MKIESVKIEKSLEAKLYEAAICDLSDTPELEEMPVKSIRIMAEILVDFSLKAHKREMNDISKEVLLKELESRDGFNFNSYDFSNKKAKLTFEDAGGTNVVDISGIQEVRIFGEVEESRIING